MRDAPYTVSEARKELEQPLKFGDPDQIRALRFLSAVSEYAEHYAGCWRCRNNKECPAEPLDSAVMTEGIRLARRMGWASEAIYA